MRHNNIERLGVIETDRAITKELGWIFREQPLVDVGVDGIIEQAESGNPTGKFIAVQIKSGSGNFHINNNYLTYYLTNVHYHYWLSLDFPIILVAYIPEEDCLFWQLICKKNIEKTNKRWKILIPKDQIIDAYSKEYLAKFFSKATIEEVVRDLYSHDVVMSSVDDYLSQSIISIMKIATLLSEITPNETPKNILALLDFDKKLAKQMMLTSKRLESEVLIFSEVFVEEIKGLEKFAKSNLPDAHYDILINEVLKKPLENTSKRLSFSIDKIHSMKEAYVKFPAEVHIVKKATLLVVETLEMLIHELNDAQELIDNFGKLSTQVTALPTNAKPQ